MNFEMVYQTCLGITALFLFFMSYNFSVNNFMSFIIYKFLPFLLAFIISIHAAMDAGYIIKV